MLVKNINRFLKKLFCKHSFISFGISKVFRQSPFHENGIGWMHYCERKKCVKCGRRKEVVL